jgi:hypothetical protein
MAVAVAAAAAGLFAVATCSPSKYPCSGVPVTFTPGPACKARQIYTVCILPGVAQKRLTHSTEPGDLVTAARNGVQQLLGGFFRSAGGGHTTLEPAKGGRPDSLLSCCCAGVGERRGTALV